MLKAESFGSNELRVLMTGTFKALVLDKTESGQTASFKQLQVSDLMEGDTVVRVTHSTLNYKDGLAVSGRAPIARKHPMVAGIDFAGVVETTTSAQVKPGDAVILNGWGASESHFGGYAEVARVKGEWLVPLPKNFTAAEAMAIGTAGYTSMLAVMALEDLHVEPASGPVLVTGAAGGVGSVAVALLHKLGHSVIASTGRPEEAEYLESLGASEIIPRTELSGEPRALAKERWAGAVDSVGSKTLANVLSMTKYGGAVAACGLAQGMDLPGSVAPFILRGVTLTGIDSVMCPRPKRLAAWERLARDLDKGKLSAMTVHAGLSDVPRLAPEILAGKVRGRVVIDVAK
jgi:acrylyl-CoA reductase (NADPH)